MCVHVIVEVPNSANRFACCCISLAFFRVFEWGECVCEVCQDFRRSPGLGALARSVLVHRPWIARALDLPIASISKPWSLRSAFPAFVFRAELHAFPRGGRISRDPPGARQWPTRLWCTGHGSRALAISRLLKPTNCFACFCSPRFCVEGEMHVSVRSASSLVGLPGVRHQRAQFPCAGRGSRAHDLPCRCSNRQFLYFAFPSPCFRVSGWAVCLWSLPEFRAICRLCGGISEGRPVLVLGVRRTRVARCFHPTTVSLVFASPRFRVSYRSACVCASAKISGDPFNVRHWRASF